MFTLVTVRIVRGKTLVHRTHKRVSTFSPETMELSRRDGIIYYLSGCILILVFGSVHFLAWSSGPTNTDELAWRVCSICVTVLSVIVFLFDPLDDSFLGSIRWVMWAWKNKLLGRILFYGSSTAPLFYIMARIGLLLLVIRSLMYCPPSALEAVPWSQLIPHV